jgi:hypothetical protein
VAVSCLTAVSLAKEVIVWLDVRSPPVNDSANDEPSDAAKHENGNILVSDDSVREADEQTKKKSNDPARPCWQLHTTDDKPDGEAAGKGTEQWRSLCPEKTSAA